MDILIRYLHFVSVLVLFGTLLAENILIKRTLPRAEIGRLARIDMAFGLSAATTLAAGLLLWFRYGKGTQFYLKNPVFHAKLGLFILVALLSIYPTVVFLKRRKGNPADNVTLPDKLIGVLRLELALAFLIPLLAVLMARGYGLE
jgi:putative membrane protein